MTEIPKAADNSGNKGVLPVQVAGEEVLCDWRGAAYFPAHKLLVISDLHFEKGSSFARRRQFVPPYDTHQTLQRVRRVIDDYEPAALICLGDSFHDAEGHQRIPSEIVEELSALAVRRDWIWISGNHDPYAPTNLPGFSADEIAVGNLTFRHEPVNGMAEGEVCGHLHPAARITRRGRTVRRACFATDGFRIVMPAFGVFTGSLNILSPAYEGLFSRQNLQALLLGDQRIYPIAAAALVPDRSRNSETMRRRRRA